LAKAYLSERVEYNRSFCGLKTGSLILVFMIVLAVLGAGLSFLGYNESLKLLTVTSTESFTATSLRVITSVSTETRVITTSDGESILSHTFDLEGLGGTQRWYHWRYYDVRIDAGQVHVSFTSVGAQADFWLLDEKGMAQFKAKYTAEELKDVAGLVHRFSSNHYESTVTIPLSGIYYVVFGNPSKGTASITVNMDMVPQQTVVTKTEKHTYYSTEQSPLVTETVTVSTQPAQFGVLFYGGIGLVVIAVILLALSTIRRKPTTAPVSVPSPGPAAVAPPPPTAAQGSEGKFCVNCGAPLSARASFCNKCGTKQ